MANNKYYYRVEIWFGHNGGIYGDKHKNIEDCKAELLHFIESYLGNDVVFIGIKKYVAATNKEFVCPQSLA